MAVGLGAAGKLGLGFEALGAVGTYVAPTKWVPIESEDLNFNQPITKRRPIQGVVDPVDSKLGPGFVEGSIKMAAYHDIVPYFLYAARTTVVKAGSGPYTYTCEGSHIGQANYTLSFLVERNGVRFGYVGCTVVSQSWTVEDGILMVEWSILGQDEATQADTAASYTSTGKEFQSGQHTLEFDDSATSNATEVTIDIDDSGSAEDRLSGTSGADLIRFGERTVNVSMARDFESRAEYDLFRAATSQKFEFDISNGTHSIEWEMPQLVADSYAIPLEGQGELVRGSVEYTADYDTTLGSSYEVVITTDENITVPT